MDKIDKIKAEIELRIAQWSQYTFACASQIASEAIDRIDELKGLLAFIDSLQDEPKKLKAGKGSYKWLEEQQRFEDIKAELIKLLTECEIDPEAEYVYRSMLLLVARHFAEWQKKQDKETIELAEDHAMFAGMEKMKNEICYYIEGALAVCENEDRKDFGAMVLNHIKTRL